MWSRLSRVAPRPDRPALRSRHPAAEPNAPPNPLTMGRVQDNPGAAAKRGERQGFIVSTSILPRFGGQSIGLGAPICRAHPQRAVRPRIGRRSGRPDAPERRPLPAPRELDQPDRGGFGAADFATARAEKATSDGSVRRPDGYPSASEAGLSPWTSGPAHAFLPIRTGGGAAGAPRSAPRVRPRECAPGAPRRRRGCAASAVPGSNPAGFGTRSDRIADSEVILFRTLVRDRVICETGVVYTIRVFARRR